MDRVFIKNLSAECVIGVLSRERVIKQCLELDIEMLFDCQPAGLSDALDDALDYSAVTDMISRFITESSFQLIETVAEQTAELILQNFSVARVNIQLRKPSAIMNAESVGIYIERSRV